MPYTPDQYLPALDRANEVRLARAELRRRIARGEVFAASVLLDPPDVARTWELRKFLTAQRRWGTKRMHRLLARLMIPETKTVGGLTDRQRRMLAEALEREVKSGAVDDRAGEGEVAR